MKLLFLLFVAAGIAFIVYISTYLLSLKTTGKKKKFYKNLLIISFSVFVVLLGIIVFGVYSSSVQSDLQCSSTHKTTTRPPLSLKTAQDYFLLGNYDYDRGNCRQAVLDYSKSIEIDSSFTQSYNNRAYTSMRLRNFKDALPDLDKAIQLNPNYINALMNRGDIHNYYYQIDRQSAIADYRRVIALTDSDTRQQTSVCGHLFLAEHNGWNLGAFIGFFQGEFITCK
ncbi:tetratricopeptide repeat protein [Patescibacteria group bacterium]|nr:tetratricopeptide repeat protein [Patescibacteria group bacterium]MCL5798326.1 tetratricopeptide repeat protein [Patescibacteria group bacterium]